MSAVGPEPDRPPAADRRGGQVGAAAAAHLAARRDGRPDAGVGADPRRHDGDGRRLPGRPGLPDLRGAPTRRGMAVAWIGGLGALFGALVAAWPVRHQAGAGVLDPVARSATCSWPTASARTSPPTSTSSPTPSSRRACSSPPASWCTTTTATRTSGTWAASGTGTSSPASTFGAAALALIGISALRRVLLQGRDPARGVRQGQWALFTIAMRGGRADRLLQRAALQPGLPGRRLRAAGEAGRQEAQPGAGRAEAAARGAWPRPRARPRHARCHEVDRWRILAVLSVVSGWLFFGHDPAHRPGARLPDAGAAPRVHQPRGRRPRPWPWPWRAAWSRGTSTGRRGAAGGGARPAA